MPTPTVDELRDAALAIAEDGLQSVTVAGQATSVIDPEKLLKVVEIEKRRQAAGNPFLSHQRLIPGASS